MKGDIGGKKFAKSQAGRFEMTGNLIGWIFNESCMRREFERSGRIRLCGNCCNIDPRAIVASAPTKNGHRQMLPMPVLIWM